MSTPPGTAATDLGLIVVLHGSEGTAAHAFDDNHGLGRFQMQTIDNGADPFALALIDGGPALWFDRDGDDRPQSMVANAFLPHLADMGFDIDRIGLYGWGAGGFGVLHLADRLGSERVAAVGSLSPAIFPAWDFVDGYYDNEDEWSAHDPRLVLSTLDQLSLRIDCGADDPFADEVEEFRNEIDPPPVGSISAGCRDYRYWHRMHPQMLEFVSARL